MSIKDETGHGAGEDEPDGIHLSPPGSGEGGAQQAPALPVGKVVAHQGEGGSGIDPCGLEDEHRGGCGRRRSIAV